MPHGWEEARDDRANRTWRKRPEWQRRGRLLDAVDRAGGQVSIDEWKALAGEAGYASAPAAFFRGDPPVVARYDEQVVLLERGRMAAAEWRRQQG